ncbi:MAG TPA: imidazole glycerol phosphate synthase subunit HisH, partial [Thermaerobacter sp.]
GAPLKVPHMGWNRVSVPAGSRLLAGLGDGFYAYFVHSYRVPWPLEPLRRRPSPSSADPDAPGGEAEDASSRRDEPATPLVALADYGGPFVAAVEWGPVCGTQFHPEKSGPAGLKILRNFGAMCGACDPGP